MKSKQLKNKYIALLRGINVGGHHKVPMQILQKELVNLDFANIITLLNSGNVIFETNLSGIDELEMSIAQNLENRFGFPVPVLIRKAEDILDMLNFDPFKNIDLTKDTRLYVSFLKQEPGTDIALPWISDDKSFQILAIKDKSVFSVLDLLNASSIKGMEILEKLFGKEITTRNWNTINKIIAKL